MPEIRIHAAIGTPLHAYDKAANQDMYDIHGRNSGKYIVFGHLSPVQKST